MMWLVPESAVSMKVKVPPSCERGSEVLLSRMNPWNVSASSMAVAARLCRALGLTRR